MPELDLLTRQLDTAISALKNERDVRFARSLRDQHASGQKPLSANQLYWAKTMIERSGQQATSTTFDKIDDDIFASGTTRTPKHLCAKAREAVSTGSILAAIRLQREGTGCTLAEAKQDVDYAKSLMVTGQDHTIAGSSEPVTANVQPKSYELRGKDLEECLYKIVNPRLEELVTQVDASAEARQEAFNKNAAKSIAQAVVVEAIKRLDARVPRQVNIVVSRPDGTTHTESGPQHPQYEELLRMASLRKDDGYVPGIFLAGERGSGKTTGCRNAAKALGMKWYANGAVSMAHEMLGWIDATGNYHRTPFRDAFEHGGFYTFDEVDRSDTNALLAVNPHLANGEAAFPDGIVVRHKDCIITATGNTWGLGGTLEFSGACKLDEAFLSRFEVKLPWDVDKTFERKLVGNPRDARGVDWYDYVEAARQRIREAGIKYTIDSRAAIAGARMITQLGYVCEQAAQQTYLASMKPDQRKIVQGLAA
jgi:hypothetical protein